MYLLQSHLESVVHVGFQQRSQIIDSA